LRVEVAEAESVDAESGPANDDEAVPVAIRYPVCIPSTWKPDLSEVDVAVDVEISSRSKRAVDDAINEYGAFDTASWRAVDVADTDWPRYVVLFHALYDVSPVASVPQTTSPAAFVSRADEQDASDDTLSPPLWSWRPANVEVAEAESAVADSGPANDDEAVPVEMT
jgi:hypothetical protein